jgi:hypothetical protein
MKSAQLNEPNVRLTHSDLVWIGGMPSEWKIVECAKVPVICPLIWKAQTMDSTLQIFRNLGAMKCRIVIQAYLYRSEKDIDRCYR